MFLLAWLIHNFPDKTQIRVILSFWPTTRGGGDSSMKIRNLASFGKIRPHFIQYLAPSMPWKLATLVV